MCLAVVGSTTKAVFEAYLERVLVPTLRPGQVMVMDNLPSHKGPLGHRVFDGPVLCLCPPAPPVNLPYRDLLDAVTHRQPVLDFESMQPKQRPQLVQLISLEEIAVGYFEVLQDLKVLVVFREMMEQRSEVNVQVSVQGLQLVHQAVILPANLLQALRQVGETDLV